MLPDGSVPSNSTDRPCATSVSAGSRPRNEKRPHRSACSTDSSRNAGGSSSPAPASFTNADTGVSRSANTTRHTGTTVWSRASATNSSRDNPTPLMCCSPIAPPAASDRAGGGPAAEGPEEAAALAGVTSAPPFLLHDEEQGVDVAVVEGVTHVLAVTRRLALAPVLLAAPAPVPHAPRLERAPQGGLVHPGEHEHLTGALLLHDRADQAVGVVLHARQLRLRVFDRSDGDRGDREVG